MNEDVKELPINENKEYKITDIISLLKKRKIIITNIDSTESIIRQQSQKKVELEQVIAEIDKKLKDNLSMVNEVAILLDGLVDRRTIDAIKSINETANQVKEAPKTIKKVEDIKVVEKPVEKICDEVLKTNEEVIADILEDTEEQCATSDGKIVKREMQLEKLRGDREKFESKEKYKTNPREDYSKKIDEINGKISDIVDEVEVYKQENKTSIYPSTPEERRLFMPKHLDGDARKTIAYIDLPNIINAIRFEPINLMQVSPELIDKYKITTKLGDYKLYFYPDVILDILNRYVWIYPNIEKVVIYSTPNWQSVNDYITEEIVQNKHPEVKLRIITRPIDEDEDPLWKYKSFAGNYDDIDWDMESDMEDDCFRSDCNNTNYSRIIIISGDKVFYSVTENFCKKNMKVHIVGHVFGINSCYRGLAIKRNALLGAYKPTNNELNVMYHGFLVRDFYDDETMQQLYKDCNHGED